jgi:ribosomal protein S25
LGDRRGRFTVQKVSDRLQIKNAAAKKILQDAARRGVLVELPKWVVQSELTIEYKPAASTGPSLD